MRKLRNFRRAIAKVVFPRESFSSWKSASGLAPVSAYFFSLCSAMSLTGGLRIVVVGANDGRINDPIYHFARRFSDRTEVFLVEPQQALLPYLRENYEFHPQATVCNVAIGEPGSITLYSVRSSVWSELRVHYARGWPLYRAPTGITSADRNHVRKWLQMHGPKGVDVDSMIEEQTVQSAKLPDVLGEHGELNSIDVLQVDTEGMDDVVIFNSGVDLLKPRLIHFEAENLPERRLSELIQFLEQRGYILGLCGRDVMGVLVGDLAQQAPTTEQP